MQQSLIGGLALCTLLSGCARVDETTPARNVVLITLDTLRADRLGSYGNQRSLTPALDRIAERGTRFEHAAAPMPETGPSHASMFTGRYPLHHGLTNNLLGLDQGVETLAEILRNGGVATAAFYNVFPFGDAKVTQGFETRVEDVGHHAIGVNGSFDGWLDELPEDRRFFAWLHFYIVHTPLEPPEEFRQRLVRHHYQGPLDFSSRTRMRIHTGEIPVPPLYAESFSDCYDAEVAYADSKVEEALQILEHQHRARGTLVVVAADHGESIEGRTLGLHAFVLRQSTMRVPLLMIGPGVQKGRSIPDVVELVDLFPTILEVFGSPVPSSNQGKSLWPVLRGEERSPRTAFGSLPTLMEEHNLGQGPGRYVIWDERWKLRLDERAGEGSARERVVAGLFEWNNDPAEIDDQSVRHPQVAESLRQGLETWIHAMSEGRSTSNLVNEEFRERLEELGYVDSAGQGSDGAGTGPEDGRSLRKDG